MSMRSPRNEDQHDSFASNVRELIKHLMPIHYWPGDNSAGRDSMSESALIQRMDEVSSAVEPWAKGTFTFVQSIQEASRNYGVVEVMGSGDRLLAMKRMPLHWMQRSAKDFEREHPTSVEKPWKDLGILRELNQINFPYACELLGVFVDDESVHVATSLASLGDLFSFTFAAPGHGREREVWMRPLVAQTIAAVGWLHELGIGHRDLSLENMLLEEKDCGTLCVKLIDFAMASLERPCVGVTGKPSYQPPEMHLDEAYDPFLADSFALGVSFFVMASQDYPWLSTKGGRCDNFSDVRDNGLRKNMAKRALRSRDLRISEALSPAMIELLENLLSLEPQGRMCLGETCFSREVQEQERASTWDFPWLEGLGKNLVQSGR